MTIQGDIFENESSNALSSLTNMKLSARTTALGWLECQWLLLLFAGDVCQLLLALSECLRNSVMADTHKHTHTHTHTNTHVIFCFLCVLPSLPFFAVL
jgi:hypothetical protein